VSKPRANEYKFYAAPEPVVPDEPEPKPEAKDDDNGTDAKK